MFAEDKTFIDVAKNPILLDSKQKQSMSAAKSWFMANSLIMNETKNQSVVFTLKPHHQEGNAKVLGIHIDSRLNWKAHIGNLPPRLNTAVYQLRKLIVYCQPETALLFYHSNFSSLISYCVLLWGNSTNASRIFKIKNKAIRILTNGI